jgi:hypothetical protein
MKNTTNENSFFIVHDPILDLYLVMTNKGEKPIRIAHFLTLEDAEQFLN